MPPGALFAQLPQHIAQLFVGVVQLRQNIRILASANQKARDAGPQGRDGRRQFRSYFQMDPLKFEQIDEKIC